MATSLSVQEATRRIESSGKIHMPTFEVALGVLVGLALLCFIARIAIRIIYQKNLRLDDAFLIVAAASLIAATGILYHILYFLYLHSAALLDPEVLPYVIADFDQLLDLQKKVYPFLALIWTTTYAVKGCFLAFMRPLVWHISRGVNWYYWFIVVFCIISWAFVIAEPFIICPYFGLDAVQCFNSTVNQTKTLVLTALVTVLDILSDVMVISIPIIILRNSFLSLSTKIGLAIFLCLSIFMVAVTIVRISGFYYGGLEDDIWEFFWQQTEGAVAVMMASITAFRTLFVAQKRDGRVEVPEVPEPSRFGRFLMRFRALAQEQPEEKPTSTSDSPTFKLPKVPSPILTGIRTFIRGNSRNEPSTATFGTLDSVCSDSNADYHTIIRVQTGCNGAVRPRDAGPETLGSDAETTIHRTLDNKASIVVAPLGDLDSGGFQATARVISGRLKNLALLDGDGENIGTPGSLDAMYDTVGLVMNWELDEYVGGIGLLGETESTSVNFTWELVNFTGTSQTGTENGGIVKGMSSLGLIVSVAAFGLAINFV